MQFDGRLAILGALMVAIDMIRREYGQVATPEAELPAPSNDEALLVRRLAAELGTSFWDGPYGV
jgi:hypothetical protein